MDLHRMWRGRTGGWPILRLDRLLLGCLFASLIDTEGVMDWKLHARNLETHMACISFKREFLNFEFRCAGGSLYTLPFGFTCLMLSYHFPYFYINHVVF